jgi:hypothetical protein
MNTTTFTITKLTRVFLLKCSYDTPDSSEELKAFSNVEDLAEYLQGHVLVRMIIDRLPSIDTHVSKFSLSIT